MLPLPVKNGDWVEQRFSAAEIETTSDYHSERTSVRAESRFYS